MSVRKFYAKLFRKNREKQKTIEAYMKKNSLPQVSKTKHNELLTVEERMISLKVDFLKVFWKRLKYFVRNALHSCFKKSIVAFQRNLHLK